MFQTFSSLSVRSAELSANSGSSLSTFFRFCADRIKSLNPFAPC